MIVLGLTVDGRDSAREVTAIEVKDSIGCRTNLICDPYHLSLYANGKLDISDDLFEMVIDATNSSARVMKMVNQGAS